jgi:hypothetical protein
LHTRTGTSFTGILTSFHFQQPQNELELVLSHVLPHPVPDPAPLPKKRFVILPKEISSITAANVSLGPSTTASSGFRTDTAISGAPQGGQQRPLEKWTPDVAPLATGMSGSLEQSSGAQWDQFATNEKMFGLKSSYSEEIYTTKVDRNHPEYQRRLRQAENIAREIENKATSNPHLAEERNQKFDDSGIDEEDKYSGVIRDVPKVPTVQAPALAYAAAAAGNKYTPPAKRGEQQRAPLDPAIISSKLRTEPLDKPVEKPAEIPAEKPVDKPKPALPLPPSTNGAPRDIPVPIVKEPEDHPPQIQEVGQKFVKEEKSKIKRARNLIGTKEKQRQFAEFAEFSNSLKLDMPVPSDLLPILAGKDANKQKAILERNQELKRKAEEKKEKSPSLSPAMVSSPAMQISSPTIASPVASPAPSLAERLKANRLPGAVPSPIASPTPLEPGVVKPLTTAPKKLDPSAKEFVFKASAKEFKPSFATPSSTHSPSPSRSSIVSPPPPPTRPRADRPEEKQTPPRTGFWDKKPRKEDPRETLDALNTFNSVKKDNKSTHEGETLAIAKAYTTYPAWPIPDGEDPKNQRGYLEVFSEGKSLPATPTSGQDDHSQSGHTYSRSSSVHPTHQTPHPPQALPTVPPVVPGYAPGHPGMYPPMNVPYGYMIQQPQQIAMHPQAGVPTGGFTPQLLPGQFPQHQQGSPYQRFQPGYQSVSPSPMMQHAIPAQYPPQQAYPNGQFPQGFQPNPMYQPVPPYGFVPQQNGQFPGHPSPGRGQTAMVYTGMPPMNMQQMYPGTSPVSPLSSRIIAPLRFFGRTNSRYYDASPIPAPNTLKNTSTTPYPSLHTISRSKQFLFRNPVPFKATEYPTC